MNNKKPFILLFKNRKKKSLLFKLNKYLARKKGLIIN